MFFRSLRELRELIDKNPETFSDIRFSNLYLDILYDWSKAELFYFKKLKEEIYIKRVATRLTDGNDEQAAWSSEQEQLRQALSKLEAPLREYELMLKNDRYANIIKHHSYSRKVTTTDPLNNSRQVTLYDHHKDVDMLYTLASQTLIAKTEHFDIESERALDRYKDFLERMEELDQQVLETFEGKLPSNTTLTQTVKYKNINRYSNVKFALADFMEATIKAKILIANKGKQGSIFGSNPKTNIILFYENTNSVKAIQKRLDLGFFKTAKESFEKAVNIYRDYRVTSDKLADNFNNRLNILNNKIVELAGYRLTPACFNSNACEIPAEKSLKGSLVDQHANLVISADLALEKARLERTAHLDVIQVEKDRFIKLNRLNHLEMDIVTEHGVDTITWTRFINKIKEKYEKEKKHKVDIYGDELVQAAKEVRDSRLPRSGGSRKAGIMSAEANSLYMYRLANIEINSFKELEKPQEEVVRLNTRYKETILANADEKDRVEHEARLNKLLAMLPSFNKGVKQAEQNLKYQKNAFAGTLAQIKDTINEIEKVTNQVSKRFYADPIHRTNLDASVVKAANDLEIAKRWTIYWINAYFNRFGEYPSYSETNENTIDYDLKRIVQARNWESLKAYVEEVDEKLAEHSTHNFQSNSVELSLKRHTFALYNNSPDHEYKVNPIRYASKRYIENHKANNGDEIKETYIEGLGAQETFSKLLEAFNIEDEQNNKWIEFHFSTTNALNSNLFRAPTFRQHQDGRTCITQAGMASDTIKSIGVKIITQNGATDLAAFPPEVQLTYGGMEQRRPSFPVTVNDALTVQSTPASFVTLVRGRPEFESFLTINPAPVILDSSSNNHAEKSLKLDKSFKEHSVAATNWKLRIQSVVDGYNIINPVDIEDIVLVINHEYKRQSVANLKCTHPAR